MCNNLPLHTHDEDHIHHQQFLKLACGIHTGWISNRDKKYNEIHQKIAKKNKAKIERLFPNIFTVHTSYKIKNWNICLNRKFCNTKKNTKKLQPIGKGPFQKNDKHTDVTYKLIDSNEKKLFNIERLFYHITQNNTLFASKHNYTLLQDSKLSTTTQSIIEKKMI